MMMVGIYDHEGEDMIVVVTKSDDGSRRAQLLTPAEAREMAVHLTEFANKLDPAGVN